MKDDNSIHNLCLHTHNTFCDGKDSIQNFVSSAIKQGVSQLGISSHAPLKSPTSWSMQLDKLQEYEKEIKRLKEKYLDEIDIFTALEIDYIPEHSFNYDFFKNTIELDYTIGSIHLVRNSEKDELWFIDGNKDVCLQNMNRIFNGDHKKAIQSYFAQTREMIITQKPDIIGHLDKVIMNTASLFSPNEAWYQDEIQKTLEVVKDNKVIVEANTRGLYKKKWNDTFPSTNILKKCFSLDIPIIISSDAHKTDELLGFYTLTRNRLKEIGFTKQKVRINNEWSNISL